MDPQQIRQAAGNVVKGAYDQIVERFPNANKDEIAWFVQYAFDDANQSGEPLRVETIVQRFIDARPEGKIVLDPRMLERMERMVFQLLSQKQTHQSLQVYEWQTAFRRTTGKPLSSYGEHANAVLARLEGLEYIRVQALPQRTSLIFRGIDFDVWRANMQQNSSPTSPITLNVSNVNVSGSGNNTRVNHQSTDNSINIASGDDAIQAKLAELRRAVEALSLPAQERADALEVVEAVENQVTAGGKPKRAVMQALLAGLPIAADVTSIAGSLLDLIK